MGFGAVRDLAIGSDGLGVLVALAFGGNYRIGHCEDALCTHATFTDLEDTGIVVIGGNQSSLTLGSDGLPFLVFQDSEPLPATLGGVHCEDPRCANTRIVTIDDGT